MASTRSAASLYLPCLPTLRGRCFTAMPRPNSCSAAIYLRGVHHSSTSSARARSAGGSSRAASAPQEMLRDDTSFSVVGLQMHKHTNPLDSLMWVRPCRERPNDPGTRHSDELPPPYPAPQSNLRGLAGEQLSARGAASSGGSSAVQRQSG